MTATVQSEIDTLKEIITRAVPNETAWVLQVNGEQRTAERGKNYEIRLGVLARKISRN